MPSQRRLTRLSTVHAVGKRSRAIRKDHAFNDCVVLSKDVFDPEAVFLDDIVDDEVLPCPSLAVDGLTSTTVRAKRRLEIRPEDAAANEAVPSSAGMPDVTLDPEQLEVYGWETSLWRKVRGYLGF